MRKSLTTSLLALTILTLSTACSSEEDGAYQRPKVWPKPVDPPPASPVYHDVDEKVPTEEDIEREAGQHNALLEGEIERALKGDTLQREIAFVQFLPQLLQVEPDRLVALHARLAPGPERDLLRQEMAQYWASSDPPAALRWIKSLEGGEQRAAVTHAVDTLAPWEPRMALQMAVEFDLGEDVRKRLAALTPREESSDEDPAAN